MKGEVLFGREEGGRIEEEVSVRGKGFLGQEEGRHLGGGFLLL